MNKKEQFSDEIKFVLNPSQWINVGWLLAGIAGAFITPELGVIIGMIWLWKCLVVYCWEFQFHEKTITERKGVFSVSRREIHYFRIKSVRVEEPFLYRLVGLCSIDLITSDPLIPVIRLLAIGNADEMRNYIKDMTAYWRQQQGVKEHDLR